MARPAGANAEQTHDELLRVARARLHEHGAEKFSLRAVAADADVALGTLHYYFGNREGLIEACLEDGYRWLEREASASLRNIVGGASIDDEVERLTRLYFRTARTGREEIRVRILTTMQRGALPEERLDGELLRMLDRVAELLGGDPLHRPLRLATQTFELIVARCAMRTDAECRAITGARDDAEAVDAMEDHLVGVAQQLFGSALSA